MAFNQELVTKALIFVRENHPNFSELHFLAQGDALAEIGELGYDERAEVCRVLRFEAAVRAVETGEFPVALKAEVLKGLSTKTRGFKVPEKRDGSFWKSAAKRVIDLKPSGGKIKPCQSYSFFSTQEQYADYYRDFVAVEAGPDFQPEVMRENLYNLCKAMKTHNGWAGSGSTWEASLKQSEAGDWYIIMEQRASVSD